MASRSAAADSWFRGAWIAFSEEEAKDGSLPLSLVGSWVAFVGLKQRCFPDECIASRPQRLTSTRPCPQTLTYRPNRSCTLAPPPLVHMQWNIRWRRRNAQYVYRGVQKPNPPAQKPAWPPAAGHSSSMGRRKQRSPRQEPGFFLCLHVCRGGIDCPTKCCLLYTSPSPRDS